MWLSVLRTATITVLHEAPRLVRLHGDDCPERNRHSTGRPKPIPLSLRLRNPLRFGPTAVIGGAGHRRSRTPERAVG